MKSFKALIYEAFKCIHARNTKCTYNQTIQPLDCSSIWSGAFLLYFHTLQIGSNKPYFLLQKPQLLPISYISCPSVSVQNWIEYRNLTWSNVDTVSVFNCKCDKTILWKRMYQNRKNKYNTSLCFTFNCNFQKYKNIVLLLSLWNKLIALQTRLRVNQTCQQIYSYKNL